MCTPQMFSCSTCTTHTTCQLPSSEHVVDEQGSVGRVYSSGTPEMSQSIQQYDKRHFVRVDEAHRCRVNSAMFMPLYTSSPPQQPFAVFEVVQADADGMFPMLVPLLTRCLQVGHLTKHKLCLGYMCIILLKHLHTRCIIHAGFCS